MEDCTIEQQVTSTLSGSAMDYLLQDDKEGYIAASLDKEAAKSCECCRGKGGRLVKDDEGYEKWVPCMLGEISDGAYKLTGAKIPSSFMSASLSDFREPEELRKSCGPIGEWLREKTCRGGFWIYGPVGRGKSHLAAAVAKSIALSGKSVRWHDGPDLFRQQRANFGQPVSEDVIEGALKVDLLVIDDVDKIRITEWTHEQLWLLLKARLERNRAVIFTSNIKASAWCDGLEFGQPLLSRLYQRCIPVSLPGVDRRMSKDW